MPANSAVSVSEADQPTQRESRQLIGIVFVAIMLRIVVLLFQGADLNTDPDAYVAHARTLLDTGSVCVPGTDRPTAFRPPVYAIVLAAFGFFGMKFSTAAAVVNLSSTVVVVIATWWLARIVGLRQLWPTICASAVALDPMLLRYSVLPMTELLSAALLSVAILQTLKLRYNQQTPQASLKSAIAAGLCFGFGGLCRPIIFLVCAVITCVMAAQYIIHRYHHRNRTPKSSSVSGLFVLPAIIAGLILIPWVVRNAVQFNHFVPATTHGGYTLLLGNNPVFYNEVVMAPGGSTWQATSLETWQLQLQHEQTVDGIDRADEVAVDKWNYAIASRNISESPELFYKSVLLRWKRFWALKPSIQTSGRLLGWATALWYGLAWLGLLACTYVWLVHRQARVQLLFWTLLSFLVVHAFYWTNARMRAPLSAVIFVLAGIGWQFLSQTIANKINVPNRPKSVSTNT